MKNLLNTLVAVSALAAVAPAFADCRGGGEHARITREFRGEGTLEVRQELGLNGPSCRGARVDRVSLTAASQRGGGTAWLEINGNQVGPTQRVDDRFDRITFELGNNNNELDREVRSIQIKLQGNIRVDDLSADFEWNRGGRR